MPRYMVHFERDHPEGPPGIESEGQMPVDADSQDAAREQFFERFSDDVASQFNILRVEKRY